MWIKICANTSLEDAQMAANLGANAVGFVFAPSVRRVTARDVAQITPHLPQSIERVGVFDSRYADEIAAIVRETGLNAVQLHGEWQASLVARLVRMFDGKLGIIQTVHWQVDEDGSSAAAVQGKLQAIERDGAFDRTLIDSRIGQATGGTGVTFNWAAARSVVRDGAGSLKMIVAGGLRPENVAEAIRELNPWGVDVASGVERKTGRKDRDKMEAFIKNARAAAAVAG